MKPLNDQIIAKPLANEHQVSAGGITLSTNSTIKKAKIVAVGPGNYENGKRVPLDVNVDDVVAFRTGHCYPFMDNGVEYIILSASDLLFVV